MDDVDGFAAEGGYTGASFRCRWHGHDVYEVHGGPTAFVLVSSDGSMRWADADEALEIVDDTSCLRCDS